MAGPTRDVGPAGRGESVAGARCRCGFGEAQLLVWPTIRVWRGMALLPDVVGECALF